MNTNKILINFPLIFHNGITELITELIKTIEYSIGDLPLAENDQAEKLFKFYPYCNK